MDVILLMAPQKEVGKQRLTLATLHAASVTHYNNDDVTCCPSLMTSHVCQIVRAKPWGRPAKKSYS